MSPTQFLSFSMKGFTRWFDVYVVYSGFSFSVPNKKVPFTGLGVAMTKDPATLMVGQYFKRKRDIVEIALTAATGIGLASLSAFLMLSAG